MSESFEQESALLEPNMNILRDAMENEIDEQVASNPVSPAGSQNDALRETIIEALKTCYDPEIPVDIWELGLIYDIGIDAERFVTLTMTLTSPGCPVAGALVEEVQGKISCLPGVLGANVDLVWEPAWTMDYMSEAAKLELGFY